MFSLPHLTLMCVVMLDQLEELRHVPVILCDCVLVPIRLRHPLLMMHHTRLYWASKSQVVRYLAVGSNRTPTDYILLLGRCASVSALYAVCRYYAVVCSFRSFLCAASAISQQRIPCPCGAHPGYRMLI